MGLALYVAPRLGNQDTPMSFVDSRDPWSDVTVRSVMVQYVSTTPSIYVHQGVAHDISLGIPFPNQADTIESFIWLLLPGCSSSTFRDRISGHWDLISLDRKPCQLLNLQFTSCRGRSKSFGDYSAQGCPAPQHNCDHSIPLEQSQIQAERKRPHVPSPAGVFGAVRLAHSDFAFSYRVS